MYEGQDECRKKPPLEKDLKKKKVKGEGKEKNPDLDPHESLYQRKFFFSPIVLGWERPSRLLGAILVVRRHRRAWKIDADLHGTPVGQSGRPLQQRSDTSFVAPWNRLVLRSAKIQIPKAPLTGQGGKGRRGGHNCAALSKSLLSLELDPVRIRSYEEALARNSLLLLVVCGCSGPFLGRGCRREIIQVHLNAPSIPFNHPCCRCACLYWVAMPAPCCLCMVMMEWRRARAVIPPPVCSASSSVLISSLPLPLFLRCRPL